MVRGHVVLGVLTGLLCVLVGTAISALTRTGELSLAALLAAQASDPVLWVVDAAPFILGTLGWFMDRGRGAVQRRNTEILRLERSRREIARRTAKEVFRRAQALLAGVEQLAREARGASDVAQRLDDVVAEASRAARRSETISAAATGLAEDSARTTEDSIAPLTEAAAQVDRLLEVVEGMRRVIGALGEPAAEARDELAALSALGRTVGSVAERIRPLDPEAAKVLETASGDALRRVQAIEESLGSASAQLAVASAVARVGIDRARSGKQGIDTASEAIRRAAYAFAESARLVTDLGALAREQSHGLEGAVAGVESVRSAARNVASAAFELHDGARALDGLASSLHEAARGAATDEPPDAEG